MDLTGDVVEEQVITWWTRFILFHYNQYGNGDDTYTIEFEKSF